MKNIITFIAVAFVSFLMLLPSVNATRINDHLILRGDMIQGGLITGDLDITAVVEFEGRELSQTEDGAFIFGFGRDYAKSSKLKITYADGHEEIVPLTIRQREYDVQHIEGLPGKMVTPPEGTWDRIASDRTMVANARNHKTDTPYFLEGFTMPAEGQISGVYGSQRILNGKPKQPHYGLDVAAPTGTLVTAPCDGVIRLAHEDMYYTGKTVIIDHGHGLSSTLMHMNSISVKEGEVVKVGDSIGTIGATGRATGSHLDWRMNWMDKRIDPVTVLNR